MDGKIVVSPSIISSLWRFFASVRLTVVLLLCMAVLSIFGTVIPQNATAEDYVRIFGLFRYQLFVLLDIVDMYHSWWFTGLMVLLVVNIVVCSVDRLQTSWRVIFNRNPKFDLKQYRQRKGRIEFSAKADVMQLEKPFQRFIAKKFRHCKLQRTDHGFAITAEKGRLSRLGVYVVHFSIVVLLLGGLVGSKMGFEGFVAIPEGEAAEVIDLTNSGRQLKLPFQIRCDDFEVSFYEGGKRPKEFRSSLTIVENGKDVLKRDVIVNAPLYHQGIGIFQSSYGPVDGPAPQMNPLTEPPEEIELRFQSVTSGMVYTQKSALGKTVTVPEGGGQLSIEQFVPNAKFQSMELGPSIIARFIAKEGEPQSITLPFNFPKFDAMRRGEIVISVASEHQPASTEERYYTGLVVSYDPGVGLVYSGFILMIVGCWIAFFMSHKQLVVDVASDGRSSTVIVSGKTNKARMGFKVQLEHLSDQLKRLANASSRSSDPNGPFIG